MLLPDTIEIACRDNTKDKVAAKIVGALAFRADNLRYRRGKKPTQLYSITHIASGKRIIDELDLRQVRIAIKRLQAIDWANPCFTAEAPGFSDPVYKAACDMVRDLRWELMQ